MTWIRFKDITEKVKIEQVLEHFNLLQNLKRRGVELIGSCPFCKNKRYPSSFSANTEKNVFYCQVCQEGGDILKLVSLLEKKSIREAGLLLNSLFLQPEEKEVKSEYKDNPPLNFQLRNLQKDHPFFEEKGLKKETIEYFGLGFCQHGIMKGQIVIPIHNEDGELIAYAGRYPSKNIPEGESKYRFPKNFHKDLVLYNLNRAKKETKETLYLVEGFFDVFHLWQTGKKNVVALMGTTMSKEQERLIIKTIGTGGKLNLAFDPDLSGSKLEEEIITRLIDKLYIRVKRLSIS
jgi:DNA primase